MQQSSKHDMYWVSEFTVLTLVSIVASQLGQYTCFCEYLVLLKRRSDAISFLSVFFNILVSVYCCSDLVEVERWSFSDVRPF